MATEQTCDAQIGEVFKGHRWYKHLPNILIQSAKVFYVIAGTAPQ